jgi:hypothetical protein
MHTKSRLTARILSGKRLDLEEPLSITVHTTTNEIMQFDNLYPSTTIKDIKALIEAQYNVPTALQRLDLLGKALSDHKTFEQCDIINGTAVNLALSVRKSMIFLFGSPGFPSNDGWEDPPDGTQNIEVRLSLNRAWELSIVLPSANVSTSDFVQSVNWTLDARPDGTLYDREAGVEISYLFWDGLWVFLAYIFYFHISKASGPAWGELVP